VKGGGNRIIHLNEFGRRGGEWKGEGGDTKGKKARKGKREVLKS